MARRTAVRAPGTCEPGQTAAAARCGRPAEPDRSVRDAGRDLLRARAAVPARRDHGCTGQAACRGGRPAPGHPMEGCRHDGTGSGDRRVARSEIAEPRRFTGGRRRYRPRRPRDVDRQRGLTGGRGAGIRGAGIRGAGIRGAVGSAGPGSAAPVAAARGRPPDHGPAPPAGSPLAVILARARAAAIRAAEQAGERGQLDERAGGCAHTLVSDAYRPPPRVAELVTARDGTCRFPSCRRPAELCDLDHTAPFDRGGPTCACNLGAQCRSHHQLKQHPRWTLRQPTSGTFRWTTPAGRSYISRPDLYLS